MFAAMLLDTSHDEPVVPVRLALVSAEARIARHTMNRLAVGIGMITAAGWTHDLNSP